MYLYHLTEAKCICFVILYFTLWFKNWQYIFSWALWFLLTFRQVYNLFIKIYVQRAHKLSSLELIYFINEPLIIFLTYTKDTGFSLVSCIVVWFYLMYVLYRRGSRCRCWECGKSLGKGTRTESVLGNHEENPWNLFMHQLFRLT